jgi:transcriptional regulator with XRE-family HTH domain
LHVMHDGVNTPRASFFHQVSPNRDNGAPRARRAYTGSMSVHGNEAVAANIRAESARRRVRQSDLAEAVGLSQATISRKLSGQVPLTIDEVYAVAEVLHVPVHVLVPDDPDPATRNPGTGLPRKDSNLQPAGRRRVISLVRSMPLTLRLAV